MGDAEDVGMGDVEDVAGSEDGTPSSVSTADGEDLAACDQAVVERLVAELGGSQGPQGQLDAAQTFAFRFSGWLREEPERRRQQWDAELRTLVAVQAERIMDGPYFLPDWALGQAAPALLRLAGDVGAALEARAAALQALHTLGRFSSRFRRYVIQPLVRLWEEHLDVLLRCLQIPAQVNPATQTLLFHALHFLAIHDHEEGRPTPPELLSTLHELLRRLNQDQAFRSLSEPHDVYMGWYRNPEETEDLRCLFLDIFGGRCCRLLRPDVMVDEPGLVQEVLDCVVALGPETETDFMRELQDSVFGPFQEFGPFHPPSPWSEDGTMPIPAHRLLLFTELCQVEGVLKALVRQVQPFPVPDAALQTLLSYGAPY